MITNMAGEEKDRFIGFIERMVVWNPEKRCTATELLNDPWLCNNFLHN
jgi:serine/threonine-protein kinase SRPK3